MGYNWRPVHIISRLRGQREIVRTDVKVSQQPSRLKLGLRPTPFKLHLGLSCSISCHMGRLRSHLYHLPHSLRILSRVV
ncbi:hypothetical protein EYF80_056315 [Liparis tanakae]|uniref:Uncharacterized protein n=1 Tax=Liparis tanakae TaxID=230148 RepID=A0A4Z2EZ61_9TELE|nr:hypothetical protein EYF80_056315 [Liparis tanakae]